MQREKETNPLSDPNVRNPKVMNSHECITAGSLASAVSLGLSAPLSCAGADGSAPAALPAPGPGWHRATALCSGHEARGRAARAISRRSEPPRSPRAAGAKRHGAVPGHRACVPGFVLGHPLARGSRCPGGGSQDHSSGHVAALRGRWGQQGAEVSAQSTAHGEPAMPALQGRGLSVDTARLRHSLNAPEPPQAHQALSLFRKPLPSKQGRQCKTLQNNPNAGCAPEPGAIA